MEMLDLTTLAGHNVYTWGWSEASFDYFSRQADNLTVTFVDMVHGTRSKPRSCNGGLVTARNATNLVIVKGRTFVMKRFYPANIMHIFHDDWLGLYSLYDLWPNGYIPNLDFQDQERGGIKRIRKVGRPPVGIVFIDGYPAMEYDEIYQWLGHANHEKVLLDDTADDAYICYEDAVVGSSKQLAWYQYGYGKMQGPIPNHQATGWKLREAALFALERLRLPPWDEKLQEKVLHKILHNDRQLEGVGETCIAIFSRLSTRLILNEAELANRLTAEFDLPVCWIRLEEHSIPELISILRHSVIAFGMHGSLLVLAMFMPPGAVLIEGFPYGVPASNYTPYKTMAGLSGMRLSYRSWTNTDPKRNVAHPEREPRSGGIEHLSEERRQFILNSTTIPEHPCCEDPHWLFRIFQDTVVDVDAVMSLMREAIKESYSTIQAQLEDK
jgi:protein O-mannose beta-1,4-N-acetylglucosaminyltransferase